MTQRESRMEEAAIETRNVAALRSQVRCVRAALLLYSLSSSPNRRFMSSSNDPEEETDLMVKEITELRMKMAIERISSKRIKLYGFMEAILQVLLFLSFFTVILILLPSPQQIDYYY